MANSEPINIGVYVCSCGTNISHVVDTEMVKEFAASHPGVRIARSYRYMCSNPGQEMISRDIQELGLNRVVVAAMAMDPNSAAVHFMACLVLRFSGKPAESIPVCKKSIGLEPVTPGIYYGNLGMAYFQNRSDCDEAVKACEKAIKLAPDGMIVHFMAATVFSACGKDKEAREAAKELLRINPKFTVESFAAKLPYKDPKEKEPVVEALRNAGL